LTSLGSDRGPSVTARRPEPARPVPIPESPRAIPLSDVRVDDAIADAVDEVLRSGWWSMGPKVGEFERAFGDFTGARALAVANGTAALHLALLAVGCGPGDEVILPSLTFVAAANCVVHTGATPVFCDVIGPHDLNMDPEDVERVITPATKAIIAFHYGGHPCRMDALLELSERHGLALIEDAAHAPGARWDGRMCGTIGDIGCFSFFSNKNLPVGEGGMLVTTNSELAERLGLLRSHGMTRLTWDRHRGHAGTYDVTEIGFNYRLDELRAAIGLVQLERLEVGNRARAEIVSKYRAALDGVDGLVMPFAESEPSAAHHLAVMLTPPGSDRNRFRAALDERRIQTSVHYPPIHQFSAYLRRGRRALPVTEHIAQRLVTLPLYPDLDEADLETVTSAALWALDDTGGVDKGEDSVSSLQNST
jgi:dTDP-4-amino-4,6-dideoxygalactose transaminase